MRHLLWQLRPYLHNVFKPHVISTSDGKLYISDSEIRARCTADATCVGWSKYVGRRRTYFRPVTSISSVASDTKWHTYKKVAQVHTMPALAHTPTVVSAMLRMLKKSSSIVDAAVVVAVQTVSPQCVFKLHVGWETVHLRQ